MPKSFHSKYYEAIIQLRPKDEKLIDFVLNECKKNNIYISKVIEHKTGVDVFVSSQKFAVALITQLKKRFKGKPKITRSLFKTQRQTSKKVYRVTVLFRLDPIEETDQTKTL